MIMPLRISHANLIARTFCSSSASSSNGTVSRNLLTGLPTSIPRQPHQRRQSSSKTPVSPAEAQTASPQHETADETPAKSSSNRVTRRRSKNSTVTVKDKDDLAGLPIVPPTNHLNQHDVGLSSFYSQHRPISLTMSTPPQSSASAFNKIFDKRPKAKPTEVIDALSHAVQSFDDQVKVVESNGVRYEIRESPINRQRPAGRIAVQQDNRPVTLDEYVSRFRPYVPPPPPEPMETDEARAKRSYSSKRRRTEVKAAEYAPRQTSYKTTILVTESVHANGQKTYTASTSPLEEVPSPTSTGVVEPAPKQRIEIRQPFLQRMQIRQRKLNLFREERGRAVRGKMLLISVKRQRKLKMKKHKYKKLMKRTRNLRRKLDRT